MFSPDGAIRLTLQYSSRRNFHTSSSRYSSPFFALAKLSNSRETQHLNKLSKLSRVEHSPNLQLIQSSEVEPFGGQKASIAPRISQNKSSQIRSVDVPVEETEVVDEVKTRDTDLLSVGRAILAEKNEQIQSLQKALEYEKDRSVKREASYALAREKSKERIHRLNQDVSSAKVWKWFLIVMGGSYAAWTYHSETVNERKTLSDLRLGSSVVHSTTPVIKVGQAPESLKFTPEPRVVSAPLTSPNPTASPVSSSSSQAANTSLPSTRLSLASSASQSAAVPSSSSSTTSQSRWPSIFWKS